MLKESQLDELVAPMLFWKFEMGLFDDPYVDPKQAERVVGSKPHRELALKAAHEAITLLKNDNHLAPLNLDSIKTIAVIGPNADRGLLGGYSGVPKHNVTVLDGIKKRSASAQRFSTARAARSPSAAPGTRTESSPAIPRKTAARSPKPSKWRERADVIVLAIGGNEQTSREAWNLQHMGDRTSLDLIGRQDELVEAIAALGKPVIALLFNGRPLSINHLLSHVPVIFECWYLGQETGHAVADVLFGDYNPGGKLPISFPRSAGHLPVFYNYKPSARRGYLFDDVSPLFAFGYGLSYTTFALTNPRLTKKKINTKGSSQVLVDVTNTGQREGTEVVQLYIRDLVSSVTRPIKELKGFRKVRLQPGETRTVTLEITPALLSFFDVNMKYVVEPGDCEVMIGNSSRDADLQKLILQVTK